MFVCTYLKYNPYCKRYFAVFSFPLRKRSKGTLEHTHISPLKPISRTFSSAPFPPPPKKNHVGRGRNGKEIEIYGETWVQYNIYGTEGKMCRQGDQWRQPPPNSTAQSTGHRAGGEVYCRQHGMIPAACPCPLRGYRYALRLPSPPFSVFPAIFAPVDLSPGGSAPLAMLSKLFQDLHMNDREGGTKGNVSA